MAFFQRTIAKLTGSEQPEGPPVEQGTSDEEESAWLSPSDNEKDDKTSVIGGDVEKLCSSNEDGKTYSPAVESVARLPPNRQNSSILRG